MTDQHDPTLLPTSRSAQLKRQAHATIESFRTYLASPAFEHSVDLMVLVRIAGDDTVDVRERRRAAEVLAKLRLQAMEGLASLVGVREQALDQLGLKTGSPTVALTQVNQSIEIVRARDWRNAAPVVAELDAHTDADTDAETGALPAPEESGSDEHCDQDAAVEGEPAAGGERHGTDPAA